MDKLGVAIDALNWIVERDSDHREFGCVRLKEWHCSEWCAVKKAREALAFIAANEPDERPGVPPTPCMVCGAASSFFAGNDRWCYEHVPAGYCGRKENP